MKVLTVVAQSLLVLFGSATVSGAAPNDRAAFTAVLAYPPGPGSPAVSRAFRGPDGRAYRFWLDAQRNPGGKVDLCELVLEEANGSAHGSAHGSNVFDASAVHGLQRWVFSAGDFAHGAQRSIYGDARTIDVAKLGLQIQIKVVHVAVKPTPATAKVVSARYRFTGVTLEVRARRR